MMFLHALGNGTLPDEDLHQDKKQCTKIERIGIGAKAIYLNGFFLDRAYYIPFSQVRRIYKRVALSKGGYTGKGLFASIPYLVVEYDHSSEKQVQFRYEQLVDAALEEIGARFPSIPLHSEEAERRLREAEEAEAKRYKKNLSPQARHTIACLNKAELRLEARPELYRALTKAARTKRMVGYTNPFYRHLFYLILLASAAALFFGLYLYRERPNFSTCFVLFGFAAIFLSIALRVRPTGRRNKEEAELDWVRAVKDMEIYLTAGSEAQGTDPQGEGNPSFPLPPQYAHPFSLRRMIRVIREGRAESSDEVLAVLKKDLQALNSSVEVSQRDYDEVVAIKPMFLCMDYR